MEEEGEVLVGLEFVEEVVGVREFGGAVVELLEGFFGKERLGEFVGDEGGKTGRKT